MNILGVRNGRSRKCSREPNFFRRLWCYPRTAVYKIRQTQRLYPYWSARGGDLFWKASILLSMFAIFVTVIVTFLLCCLCRCCRCCCWRDGYGSYETKHFGCDGCFGSGMPCIFESCLGSSCCSMLCCCFHSCIHGGDGLPSVKFDPRADRLGR